MEAKSIAKELLKLYNDGVISGPGDSSAVFYARLIHDFGATYVRTIESLAPEPPQGPTLEQLVRVPRGISRQQERNFLKRDLEDVFGE